MKLLLLLPLLLGFSVPAIAHNEANGGNGEVDIVIGRNSGPREVSDSGEGEGGIDRENTEAEIDRKQGLKGEGI